MKLYKLKSRNGSTRLTPSRPRAFFHWLCGWRVTRTTGRKLNPY